MKQHDNVTIDDIKSIYACKLPAIDIILFGCVEQTNHCYNTEYACVLDPNCFMIANLIQLLIDRNVTKNINENKNRYIDVYIKKINKRFYSRYSYIIDEYKTAIENTYIQNTGLNVSINLFNSPSYRIAKRYHHNLRVSNNKINYEPYTRYHSISTVNLSSYITLLDVYKQIIIRMKDIRNFFKKKVKDLNMFDSDIFRDFSKEHLSIHEKGKDNLYYTIKALQDNVGLKTGTDTSALVAIIKKNVNHGTIPETYNVDLDKLTKVLYKSIENIVNEDPFIVCHTEAIAACEQIFILKDGVEDIVTKFIKITGIHARTMKNVLTNLSKIMKYLYMIEGVTTGVRMMFKIHEKATPQSQNILVCTEFQQVEMIKAVIQTYADEANISLRKILDVQQIEPCVHVPTIDKEKFLDLDI